jgi:hypothetical protein
VSWLYKISNDQVRRLLHDAMLDPAIARKLVGRATAEKMNWLGETLRRRDRNRNEGRPTGVS